MKHELFHIYGPFSIYTYGLAITIGLLIFSYILKKHPLFEKLKLENHYTEILLVGVISALFGGRFLFVLSHYHELGSPLEAFAIWNGGLSLLGSILAVLFIMPLYLKKIGVPIIQMLDLLGIHIPLLQSISRVGCFFAGCCYGTMTTYPWGIVYTDKGSIAPLYQRIHPTQLYSTIALLLIFALMYFVLQKILKKQGQLITSYLMLVSAERFLIDFWRADRLYLDAAATTLSVHQLIALAIFIPSLVSFCYISANSPNFYRTHEHI